MSSHDPSVTAATEVAGAHAAEAGAGIPLTPGTRLGPYVIQRLLGEGGMGRVYLAEQVSPVRREVALKLIREQVVSPLALAYFEVERQALAQMQHPAIAQVFDAGTTPDGHAYLAMEYVEGVSITRFCADERLALDPRLALFVRVCRGVQHAHQKGVIHRDLKPGNVLVRRVDGQPTPKIIDFGIAIGGDGERGPVHATPAERAGTAIYMSPEQAAGATRDLDTRSDVYSLGVMLFEVLTGNAAAALTSGAYASQGAADATLHATLLAAETVHASPATGDLLAAARRLPVELRAVLRKALAPDRNDRYESAAALAEDLERFQGHRPLAAMPAARLYLARKFVARHRLGLAATGAAALALLAGIALAVHGQRNAEIAAAQARVEAAKAEQVSKFVGDMLAGIDPDRAKSMDRSLMRMVLDSAADRAKRELNGQPAVRAEIERTIGESYMGIGEYALAEQHFVAALRSARTASAGVAQQGRLLVRQAEAIDYQGHVADAAKLGDEVLALIASLPAGDADRLYVESHVGSIDCDANRSEDCRKRCADALAGQRRVLGENDPETLGSMGCLAYADSNLARFDEARSLYRTLIERYRAHYGDANSNTLSAINSLAVVDLEQKRFADAEKLLAPILPISERVFGPDHARTLTVVTNLGGAIRQQGRNEEARPYYERALAIAQKQFGPDSVRTVMSEANLADLLRDAGQLADADRHARIAVAHAAKAFGADNAYRGIIIDTLATILIREKHYAEAEQDLDQAYALLDKGMGPDHPRTQDVVDHYIELYTAWGKSERATAWRTKKAAPAATKTAAAG